MAQFNSSVFAAGAYSVTWNSLALGLMVGDQQSPIIDTTFYSLPINNTDAYGRMTLGSIRQGSDCFYQSTLMEYKSNTIATFWPFTAIGRCSTAVGADDYESAQALVLTAQSGTVAASAGPATVTASKAFIAPNYNPRLILGNVLREIPLRLQLYPYISSVPVHFTVT